VNRNTFDDELSVKSNGTRWV